MHLSSTKRGRRKEEDNSYYDRTQKKIDDLRKKLKTAKADGLDAATRQRLRN